MLSRCFMRTGGQKDGAIFIPLPRVMCVPNTFSLLHVTYLQSWALLEKLPIVQLLKNFPAFYGTRRFITMFTRALHWSLSWARSVQSIPSHPCILILSTHLRLGLPSDHFPSGFPTNILWAFLFSPFVLPALPISSSLTWSFSLCLLHVTHLFFRKNILRVIYPFLYSRLV
jgi:hypothetical protein